MKEEFGAKPVANTKVERQDMKKQFTQLIPSQSSTGLFQIDHSFKGNVWTE